MSSFGIHGQVGRHSASGITQVLNRSNVLVKGDFMSTQMVAVHSPEEPGASHFAPVAPSRYICFCAFHLDLKRGELLRTVHVLSCRAKFIKRSSPCFKSPEKS